MTYNGRGTLTREPEFEAKLKQLQKWSQDFLVHYNGAIRVNAAGNRRSIGVTSVLTNYYKPSYEDAQEIAKAADKGKATSFAAVRSNIDDDT